ncbi:MAG TPA: hypothetical protein DDW85_05990 [Porphyromonadaceae bacterium]|nr:hypothetical protein [Porphyromonadaceae bacterium]
MIYILISIGCTIILPILFIVLWDWFKSGLSAEFDPYKDDNFKLGVYKTILKGTQYRWLFSWDIGTFKGKAVAQTNNKYDEYAVAIYNGRGKHIGFAPRGYMTLHQSILDRGGSVYCCGILRHGDINSNVILGDVYIDFDKSYWSMKNKELGIRSVYKSPNFKKYIFELNDGVKEEKKFYGKATVISNEGERCIIINDGVNDIGVLNAADETVYNSIEDFHSGETLAWGNIIKDRNPYDKKTKYFGFAYIPIKCSQNKINKELSDFKNK